MRIKSNVLVKTNNWWGFTQDNNGTATTDNIEKLSSYNMKWLELKLLAIEYHVFAGRRVSRLPWNLKVHFLFSSKVLGTNC